jgi:hypothetical protein
MEIPVLIEPVAGNGFRASALNLTVEGGTEAETLQKLTELLAARQAQGAKVVSILVPGRTEKLKYIGTWKPDDPDIEEWKRAVEEYRRQKDVEADGP